MELHRFIIRARQNVECELSQIGNMDEVPLTFDVPSNKTEDVIFFFSKHPCKIGVRLIQWCVLYAYKYGNPCNASKPGERVGERKGERD